jgi:hypothetical protein
MKVQLTRVLGELNECGLLHEEPFGFRPRHNMTLQLARLVQRRLTGGVFLAVGKAFHIVWVSGLLFRITVRNFPSYLVKAISYLDCQTFQTFFHSATASHGVVGLVALGGLFFPVLFSLYMKYVRAFSRHVDLAQ